MTPQSEHPAAIWTDRWSDRLGAFFIPSSYRLSPRHPLKVSLIMGMLGQLSGWTALGVLFLLGLTGTVWIIELFSSVAMGFVFGTIVLMPWGRWIGLTTRVVIRLILCSTACYTVADIISQWITITAGSNTAAATFIWSVIISASLGLAGVAATGHRRLKWFLLNLTVCVGTSLALWFLVETTKTQQLQVRLFLLPELDTLLLLALVFPTFQTTSAICLGMLIWDTAPRLKFESPGPEVFEDA